jgi:putative component of toxin-antitoxin plasmid stabilization module
MAVLLQTKEFSEWLHGLRDLVARARVVARLSAAEAATLVNARPSAMA